GDPVFDGILRQGLSVQLEQSPFLTLVSDQQLQQVLRFMNRPPTRASLPRWRRRSVSEPAARLFWKARLQASEASIFCGYAQEPAAPETSSARSKRRQEQKKKS